jgi:tetratricopeptide (TPR) repeat protein
VTPITTTLRNPLPPPSPRRHGAVFLGLALLCALTPARAAAQAPARESVSAEVALAEKYAEQAFTAYKAHDYERAIGLYQQALAAAPSADILYNIARVYDIGLHDRRHALTYYERYLADPGAVSKRRETASERLSELRAAERLGVDADEDDALNAIARDFPLDTREAAPAASPAPPREPEAGLEPLEVAAISAGTIGLVGVGIGVGFGLAARSESDVWRSECDGNVCTSQRGVDAAETASRRADVATIGFAVGGGLIAVGAVLWLLDGSDERPEAAALRLAPSVGESSLGGVLSGRF